jgi:xylan 1,4-beta-xylosidase
MKKEFNWIGFIFVCCMVWTSGLSGAEDANAVARFSETFETDSWKHIFAPDYWGDRRNRIAFDKAPNGEKCLRLPAKCGLKGVKMRYSGGTIEVSVDVKNTSITPDGADYRVAWITVSAFETRESEKELSHQDVYCTSVASDWKTRTRKIRFNARCKYYTINILNAGKAGTLWIDNLSVKETIKDGINLLGDSEFAYPTRLGADFWQTPQTGKDWDNISIWEKGSNISIKPGGICGRNFLEINGTGTVVSERFPYAGEELFCSVWMAQENIKTGVTEWAHAGVQLVMYDAEGKVMAHTDITPLRVGVYPWRYFEKTMRLSAKVASVELWLRVFQGAKGIARFADLRLIRKANNSGSKKIYNGQKASFTIDTRKAAVKPICPIWNGSDVLYISWANSSSGQMALKKLVQAKVAHLRFHNPMQWVCTKFDKYGNPILDFSRMDKALDNIVTRLGMNLCMTIETIPLPLCPDVPKRKWNLAHPPTDLKKWGEIVESILLHLVDRYGKEKVKNWYFEVWNEPGSKHYFAGSLSEYLAIYDTAMDAILRVEKARGIKLKKGTMSALNSYPWMQPLLSHLHKKGTLKHLDFISFHIYSGFAAPFDMAGEKLDNVTVMRDRYPELKDKPIIITEYHGTSMASEYFDNYIAGVYNIKAIRVFLDKGVEQAYYFSSHDIPHRDRKYTHFSKQTGLVGMSGVCKSGYQSLLMLNSLRGGRRIPFQTSNEPLDGIAVIHPSGKINILCTLFDERKIGTTGEMTITGIIRPVKSKTPRVRLTRLDRDHGDPYTAWEKLGKPKFFRDKEKDRPTLEAMKAAATLKAEPLAFKKKADNTIEISLKAQANSAFLIEIDYPE